MAIHRLRLIWGVFKSSDEIDTSALTFLNIFKLQAFKFDKFSRRELINQRTDHIYSFKTHLEVLCL